MIPKIKKIDATNFNKTMRALSTRVGASLPKVVEYESGKVIEGALKGTAAAKVSAIRANMEEQEFGMYDTGKGRKKYSLKNRYPDVVWQKICALRKASLLKKLGARGLAKRSWLDLARVAGFAISAPGFVRSAIPRTGQHYSNSTALRRRSGHQFGIYFENRQPTVQFAGGRRALLRAINGRSAYFRKNLRLGVFEDLKKISRAYPGMIM